MAKAEAILGSNPGVGLGISNLRTVLSLLDAAGVPQNRIALDLGLARGLDYYTGIVFETTVKRAGRSSAQHCIPLGGRYDNLASLFTSRRLPGVGASIGLDRLLALMDEAGWLKAAGTTVPVLVANFPGTDAAIRFKARRLDYEPPASAPRCTLTRSRSASRWATARPAATNWESSSDRMSRRSRPSTSETSPLAKRTKDSPGQCSKTRSRVRCRFSSKDKPALEGREGGPPLADSLLLSLRVTYRTGAEPVSSNRRCSCSVLSHRCEQPGVVVRDNLLMGMFVASDAIGQ